VNSPPSANFTERISSRLPAIRPTSWVCSPLIQFQPRTLPYLNVLYCNLSRVLIREDARGFTQLHWMESPSMMDVFD